MTIILYSRRAQRRTEVCLRLALRKQYHRTMQKVLLNIHDACLIFKTKTLFKILVKKPTNFNENEKSTLKMSLVCIIYLKIHLQVL